MIGNENKTKQSVNSRILKICTPTFPLPKCPKSCNICTFSKLANLHVHRRDLNSFGDTITVSTSFSLTRLFPHRFGHLLHLDIAMTRCNVTGYLSKQDEAMWKWWALLYQIVISNCSVLVSLSPSSSRNSGSDWLFAAHARSTPCRARQSQILSRVGGVDTWAGFCCARKREWETRKKRYIRN